MATRQITIAAAVAVVMICNPPASHALGAFRVANDFPPLKIANETECLFSNDDLTAARKSLLVWIDPRWQNLLRTSTITCPATPKYNVFGAEIYAGILYGYYPSGHSLWHKEHGEPAEYKEYSFDRTSLSDPIGNEISFSIHVKPSNNPTTTCLTVESKLKKQFGSFATICDRFHYLVEKAEEPEPPRGVDYLG
ncbi:hypothetical protein FOZ60_007826 [Perkinsus olseni]|uniref:Uncharacterized protein n=1 Tax=Perkinsus olseni TaxID=32597 RepID=A0A7J6NKY3_PEROL|nr:hypothetical protein FOZ60_007826 [Perkinsus olseni]